jgi:hypothetical protein
MTGRTPQQITRQFLKAAKESGVIKDFTLRTGGKATIYYADSSDNAGQKTYTKNALDTLTVLSVLSNEGFRPPKGEGFPS